MTANKAQLVDAACRSDFASFARKCFHSLNPGAVFRPNWHIRALAYHLEQARLGKINRLAISMPPRHAKSLMSSVAFPAFVLGHDPTKRVIAVSYAAELAIKHSNDFREIINAAWYTRLFPALQISKNTESEVSTTQHGYRLATSIDGTLTGRGGDILIIDDYLKPIDALSDSRRATANNWFFNTALSRLDDKQNGAVVIVGQRLHPDDLIGTLIRSSDAWTTLALAAIAEEDETIKIGDGQVHHRRAGEVIHPEREPIDLLEMLRSQIGAATFAAHYQQCPIPPGGSVIQRSWFRSYAQLPTPTSSSMCFQSWDTAAKPGETNAWSVCTTWLFHEGKYYLVDVLRIQVLYPSLRDHAIAHAKMRKPANILIEDTAVGCGLIPELRNAGFAVAAVRPEGDKQTRMAIQSVKFQRGQVLFPDQAPWLVDVETELLAFPGGRHDDIVDSISQALAYAPVGYDVAKIADGMERICSAHAFEQWCRNNTVV